MIYGMTASRPDPLARFEGTVVLLRAWEEKDLPALFTAIGRPEIFAGGWGGGMGAYRDDFEQWSEFLRQWLPWQQCNVYAVCLRSEDDRVIGTTTLGDFDLENESAHIGWTAYSPHVWGSGVNADAKRLLLNAAFTHGFERVRLQADVLNIRSRAAIERIGAQPEGVLRHVQRRADGSWRDTAIYSILREEWTHVRTRLEQRLAA
jgi:RimJ/RimL family protein N-acetyltransferase